MNIEELIEKNELELTGIYKEIDKICRYNSKKVLYRIFIVSICCIRQDQLFTSSSRLSNSSAETGLE